MSNVIIYMNGEPLGAVQKWEEDYFTSGGLLQVTIKIERIIFDDFSILGHILDGGEVELAIEVGKHKTTYRALQLKAGSRDFTAENGIHTEQLVLSTAHQDKELGELKDYLAKLITAKKLLHADTIHHVTM
jgi:hypothetical protein